MSVDRLKRMFSKTVLGSDAGNTLSLADSLEDLPSEHTGLLTAPASLAAHATPPAPVAPTAAALRRDSHSGDSVSLPLLGTRSSAEHQRILLIGLAVALVVLLVVAVSGAVVSRRIGQQLSVTGQALTHSQRLAKSVSQALVGVAPAFADVSGSADVLVKSVQGLKDGNADVAAVSSDYRDDVAGIAPLAERAEKNAKIIMAQQPVLTGIGLSLSQINSRTGALQDLAENILALKVEQGASATEISAVGRLLMLTQRIGKSSTELLSMEGVNAEVVSLLGKDLATFKDLAQGLLHGSSDLRLPEAHDIELLQQLDMLNRHIDQTRADAGGVMGSLQGVVAAREAQASIIADSEPLRRDLETLQQRLAEHSGIGGLAVTLLALATLTALLCAYGLAVLQVREGDTRKVAAEAQTIDAERLREHAERLQLDAKRVNDANQAAILRLMNELQMVAEGDLTQQATVTEDITGAIADSVNYTVEELRTLVANVQNTASRVAETTADVDTTSTELLAASNEQMNEIQATGKSVLEMAARINQVSSQAQQSADVARQSLKAAESGLQAVQHAIGGMNSIRDQIQETSKRIKRLGESSQEIGEITELISDITDQTNVLALNAAIQAASAGEAGRGFSVVAEEVQRLAERSADATRQISALVKAIQTDTQDAVAAMERSTQGVVEGAKLSDNAGTRLTEIDQVSRRLSELILQISDAASREANLANAVADSIQNIFAVTEQTSDGTRSTAGQVRELSRMAEELRLSVARFKIA